MNTEFPTAGRQTAATQTISRQETRQYPLRIPCVLLPTTEHQYANRSF